VWINLLLVAGSYAIVIAGAFIVNLFRAPGLLDKERAGDIAALTGKLQQQADDVAALTEKLEASREETQGRVETRITFASLMKEGKAIEEKMLINQNPHEHNAISESFSGWTNRTADALAESGYQTDATIFRHSGERPTDKQQGEVVSFYLREQRWKHYDVTRASIYLAKLQEIIERKNL
jgi:hypothetical protein